MSLFRNLGECSHEDIQEIVRAITDYQENTPKRIENMVLSLRGLHGGFEIDQFEHALQTATRAERAGASEEIILLALCHDIGKAISWVNHAAVGAEILRPFVSEGTYWIALKHQDFQERFYNHHLGRDTSKHLQYKNLPNYSAAVEFSGWDSASFDKDYDTFDLPHFEVLLEKFFSKKEIV